MNYKELEAVNKELKTTPIKGKEYAEVNQRILAFRKLYPEGYITTEMLSNKDGVCVFKATAGYYTFIDGRPQKTELATGTAYEKENSSFINKTSFIENCETSAVGRALAMLGIGVDTSIASAEEVGNAIANQKKDDTGERNALKAELINLAKEKGLDINEVAIDYKLNATTTAERFKEALADLREEGKNAECN